MNKYIAAFKAAFPLTLPICAAFLFLGMSFGLYFTSMGFPLWYPILTSMTVFAGSMEFVLVTLLLSPFNPLYAFFMALMINARHLFYGLSMLEKYKNTGLKKFYLIFGMCDESFAINVSTEIPAGIDKGWFMTFINILNHLYWVTGSALGAIIGSNITINTKGLEFVLTALFIAIFVSQWQNMSNHKPALAGLVIPTICLLIFGSQHFIPPAMILIVAVFMYVYKHSKGGEQA